MTAHIITIILVLTDILVYYTFLKTVLKRKSEKPLDYFLFVVLFILTSISTLFLNDYLPVKLLVNFILKFVISFIVFKVSFKKILLSNLAYTGVLYSIEFTLLLIVEQLCNVTGLSEIPVSDAVISELICQFTVLIVVFVLNIAYRKGVFSNLDIKGWFIFAFFPLFTAIAVIDLVVSSEAQSVKAVYSSLSFLAAGMFILNILLFILLDNVVKRENEIREKELLFE